MECKRNEHSCRSNELGKQVLYEDVFYPRLVSIKLDKTLTRRRFRLVRTYVLQLGKVHACNDANGDELLEGEDHGLTSKLC